MPWIPIFAWIGAVVVAIAVFGFCAYEIVWKANRLRADLRRLEAFNEQMRALQRRLEQTQERIAASGLR